MPLNNFGRLSRVFSCVFLFSLVLNLAHADTSIWDSFRGGKGLFSDDSGQVCVGLDQATRGVCMTRRDCGKQGGKIVGYCGVSSTCCSLTTCGYAISSKEAILTIPNVGRNFPGLECSYNIVPHNRHVTQIRIDLEILTLSQPTTDNNDGNGNGDENLQVIVEQSGIGRSGGDESWNGNVGSNGGNNGNGNTGNKRNNGGWNNNGNSDGWNSNNGGSNNGGNNSNSGRINGTKGNGWQRGRKDNTVGRSNGNNNTPTTVYLDTTNTNSSNTSTTYQSGTDNHFSSSSGDHQRYRRAVEDGEIKSDYDEDSFFRNAGLEDVEDVVQTRSGFGGEYDDGWNAEVVNSEDSNTRIQDNSDVFRTTPSTAAPATIQRTNPRPNPDNNENHGNNGDGLKNGLKKGNSDENDQPQEYKCRHDVFEVTNFVDSRTIIPHLCGENSGQHLYISLDSFKSSGIRISLKIADRQNDDNLPIPNWRIRIRQIEDRGKRSVKDLDDFNRQDETINAGVGGLTPNVSGRHLTPTGEQLLAPAGCLQYYPERTGTFESFNYNSGKGPYLPKLRYAICFKRTSSVCGVKLMARKFQLSSMSNKNHHVDSDCEAPDRDNNRGDYLLIPDGVSKLGRHGTKWCGNSAQLSVVAFASPGPLYVFFNSDKYITRNGKEIGFKMSYAVLNNC